MKNVQFLRTYMSCALMALGVIALLLCVTTCKKNSDFFAKNIPECIKQKIKADDLIINAEEYCTQDGVKKIYRFKMRKVIFNKDDFRDTIQIPPQTWDENCNLFLLDSDEGTFKPLNPEEWVWANLLPDGTIKYKDNIYHFERIVFTRK